MIRTAKPSDRQRNRPLKDYAGHRFGRLVGVVLIERDVSRNNNHLWRFACDCGSTADKRIKDVRAGKTASCGCLAPEVLANRNRTHGLSKTPEYKRWKDMRARCENPRNTEYANYGGRGIKVCSRWADFSAFLSDMGVAPPGHTIDRIDVDGDYEPANCRWVLPEVQANNKRNNVRVEIDGETKTLSQWCRQYGVYRKTVAYRLGLGMSPKDALTAADLRK